MALWRGGQALVVEARTGVNRHEFGLPQNLLQGALQIVGDQGDITIQVEANTLGQR